MKPDVIYLDHAAATPLDPRAKQAMEPFFDVDFYNPSSPYAPAITVRHAYEDAKDSIARAIGAKGDELIMTAGATESINLAFNAVSGHVITSVIEHHAVLAAAKRRDHTLVAVSDRGVVDTKQLAAAIRPDTQLISIALANNEIGTVQPLREIAAMVQREREHRRARGDTTPLYLHSDASQGLGLLDVHVARLGVDMLTLNAAKVYGPKQVGLLWTARGIELSPLIVGGGQERGLRSGTENVAGTVGFACAFEQADNHRKSEADRLRTLRDSLKDAVIEAFPNAVISGHPKHQLPNFLHVSFPDVDAERVLFTLEAKGILVATGSACAANKGTRSHVLTAIGLDPSVADGSIRMTLGKLSNEANIRRASEVICETVAGEYRRVQR